MTRETNISVISLKGDNFTKELKSWLNQTEGLCRRLKASDEDTSNALIEAESQFRQEHKQTGGQHKDFLDSDNKELHDIAQGYCDELNLTEPTGKEDVRVVYNVVASKYKDNG